jgi:hypothetical protein
VLYTAQRLGRDDGAARLLEHHGGAIIASHNPLHARARAEVQLLRDAVTRKLVLHRVPEPSDPAVIVLMGGPLVFLIDLERY